MLFYVLCVSEIVGNPMCVLSNYYRYVVLRFVRVRNSGEPHVCVLSNYYHFVVLCFMCVRNSLFSFFGIIQID